MGIKIILACLLFTQTLWGLDKRDLERTNSVHIRFYDVALMDLDLLQARYGFVLQHCILDGLCVFENTKKYDKKMLEQIVKEEKNIKKIRMEKKYKMKPY